MSEWTDSDGNRLGEWEVISREEYDRQFAAHDLNPFSTLTDPDGAYGTPQVYTAWGLRGADAPLIDIRDYRDRDGNTTRQICRKFVTAAPVVTDPTGRSPSKQTVSRSLLTEGEG
jgi:hypothetical protein